MIIEAVSNKYQQLTVPLQEKKMITAKEKKTTALNVFAELLKKIIFLENFKFGSRYLKIFCMSRICVHK